MITVTNRSIKNNYLLDDSSDHLLTPRPTLSLFENTQNLFWLLTWLAGAVVTIMSNFIADELCRGRQRSEFEIVKPALYSWPMSTSLSPDTTSCWRRPAGTSTPPVGTWSTFRKWASSVADGPEALICLASVNDEPLPLSLLLTSLLPGDEKLSKSMNSAKENQKIKCRLSPNPSHLIHRKLS